MTNSEQAFDNALDRVGVMAISGSLNQDDLDAVTTAHQKAITDAEVAVLEKLLGHEWQIDGYEAVISAAVLYAELNKRGAL